MTIIAGGDFKPMFTGYLKFQLEAETPDRLLSQAVLSGQWITKSSEILKERKRRKRGQLQTREFQITLTMYDIDGYKRGFKAISFVTSGGFEVVSAAIDQQSDVFKAELLEDGIICDMRKSVVVIRA